MKYFIRFINFSTVFAIISLLNSCKEEVIVEKPEISIPTINNVLKTSIDFSFNLIKENGGVITEIGVCWDTIDYPKTSKNKLALNIGASGYNGTLNDLSPGTKYYIRSYAINSAGTGYSEVITFTTYSINYAGTITDIDNNEYEIISLGNQTWMAENLKTTKLNDNTAIQQITDNAQWAQGTDAAYCWYSNDENENFEVNGALYNFFTIETGKLCPEGYHIPTVQDWQILEGYLISAGYNFDGSTMGSKYAKSIASNESWAECDILGSIGNDLNSNNKTGFNAYPAGMRNNSGIFSGQPYTTSFWTNNTIGQTKANTIDLFSTVPCYYINENPKVDGFSVRCIKD